MTNSNRYSAAGGVTLIVAMVGAYVSQSPAEPQSIVATTAEVTSTDAATASLPPVTAATQDASPMGAAVAVEVKATIVEDEPMPPPELADPDGVHWFDDYEQAKDESERTGKPLIVFSTQSGTRCARCVLLKRGAFSDHGVIAWLNKDYVCCELVDEHLPQGVGARSSFPAVWLRFKGGLGWIWEGGRQIATDAVGFRNAIDWASERRANR